ncbi:MAG: HAMP domain-containing protein [Alphaproteobacteria bacterium]|nr:HAMP domain-containing protein [Alphaproteobacteria bacterium]
MFVSINKKIIYSILFLFFITSFIFVATFYMVYGNKIQEEQLYSIQRNQQYIDLLYRNINMIKDFRNIITDNPNIKIDENIKHTIFASEKSQLTELSNRKEQLAKINQSFDERYQAIQTSLQIFGISSILLFITIILVGYLISRWVLTPINRISNVSEAVSKGNLKIRIDTSQSVYFRDELDNLIKTFNQMLDNLETVIHEVKDKEAFLQALIDSIPDGIRVIDKNYNIIIANQAYYKQIGSDKNKKLKCYEASQHLKHPCNEKTHHCPLHAILQNKQKKIRVVQQFCQHPDRHLSINAAPLTHYGKKDYIVESIRDLSDDINFSHQQKLSSLGFLSTSIAHEMKNQLGALRMIVEHFLAKFYQDKADSAEDKKLLNTILSELINCISVPERLLKLTRGSSSDITATNCIASIDDVISLLDFEAKSKGIVIKFEHPDEEIFINGNETDFKMVAINLILNALKAIDGDGGINITLHNNKKNIRIDFADTGIGIPKQDLNRIFDPFFSNGIDGGSKGNGLGLSISKTIVEKAGGTISVKSQVGQGSIFSLSFPKIKNLAK